MNRLGLVCNKTRSGRFDSTSQRIISLALKEPSSITRTSGWGYKINMNKEPQENVYMFRSTNCEATYLVNRFWQHPHFIHQLDRLLFQNNFSLNLKLVDLILSRIGLTILICPICFALRIRPQAPEYLKLRQSAIFLPLRSSRIRMGLSISNDKAIALASPLIKIHLKDMLVMCLIR